MATTVGDIIRSSLRKIGVLAAGEPLTAGEGADALQSMQSMVEAWTLEPLLIPVVSVVTFELIAGQSEYTIGIWPGEDTPPANHIETARPEQIIAAFIRDPYNTDYPQTFMDVDTFSRISRKTTVSRPSRFYVRKGWPLNTILFESEPYQGDELHLEVVQPFSEYLSTACLTDAVNLPPGYINALTYNLCIELADEWGKQVSNAVAITAVNGKKMIKRSNYKNPKLFVDRALSTKDRAKGTYIIDSGP